MVLIAISWIYILFTAINFGCLLNKLLKLKNSDFSITAVLGLFGAAITANFWAFFAAVGLEFHIFLLFTNVILALLFRMQITSHYRELRFQIRKLTVGSKIILATTTILIIAQCAAAPYVVDNESYYIQTIKWINEYGFVKGLGNFHYFFGQTSGWHIAQSAFSFSFLYPNFNDLSGFCLLFGNLFAITKLNQYYINRDLTYLILGLFPIANVFFFRFIGTPSPDIAIYVLSFIIIYQFFESYTNPKTENFNLLLILVLFAVYCKPTSIMLASFPIVIFIKHFRIVIQKNISVFVFAVLILGLYIAKSLVLTGYALFPFPISFGNFAPDYQIPLKIVDYFSENKMAAFQISNEQYQQLSFFELFMQWLTLPGLHGLLNKLALLLILISPLFILRLFNNKKYWIVYFVMVLQLIILFAFSPQYRFFINFILFFGFLCMSPMLRNRKVIEPVLYLATGICAVLLLIPINLGGLTNNKIAQDLQSFSSSQIIFPHSNSQYQTDFDELKKGNLYYYSPTESNLIWETGDGSLPCVNKVQIDFFEKNFNVTPQLRGTDLSDGFYSKTSRNE